MTTPIIPARWFACTLDVVYVSPGQKVPRPRHKPFHHDEAFSPGWTAKCFDSLAIANPYLPYYVGDEQSSISNRPALPGNRSFEVLLGILETNYEFRKGLCETLSAADVTNMASAFGLKLTKSEKMKYLNPAKVVTEMFPAIQECIDKGWGVTVLGPETSKVINSLINPVGGSKRCVRPEQIEGQHHSLPAQVASKCLLLFTAPQLGTNPEDWGLTFGTEVEFQEFLLLQDKLEDPMYSEWSCTAFKMISAVHGFFQEHEQRPKIRWPREGFMRARCGTVRLFPKTLNIMADETPLRARDNEIRSRPGSTVRYMNLHCAAEEMKIKTLGVRDSGCLLQKMIN